MPFKFDRAAGVFYDTDGSVLCDTAYSGHGEGVNNPEMEQIPNVGPLPAGTYTIGPPHEPIDHLGPVAMPLTPDPSNEMYGRFGFYIHGDTVQMNHTASDGCIILPRIPRSHVNDINNSGGDRKLEVV